MNEKNLLTLHIANKIRQLKKEKNLSNGDLSVAIGVGESYLSELLSGKKRFNLIHIEKICKALSYPVAKLFSDDIEAPPTQADPKTPLEEAFLGMFRGLSATHKGDAVGFVGELRLAEAMPRRESKKAGAAS